MENQVQFLILLGAYENSYYYAPNSFVDEKIGITNEDKWYKDTEELYCKVNNSRRLSWEIYNQISKMNTIEASVDGSIFIKEEKGFTSKFRESMYKVIPEIELNIHFDGYSLEEAREISENTELFTKLLNNNKIQYSYITEDNGDTVCILNSKQIHRLAVLSIKYELYKYIF